MEVREAVSDVLARWRHLAGALGVKPGQTSTIEASNRGAVERCMEESLLVWLRMYLLASQDVFIRSYIHLMSTTQLDRSRSPTMPCILLVYRKSLPDVRPLANNNGRCTGAAHTVILIQRQHAHKIAEGILDIDVSLRRKRRRDYPDETLRQTAYR